MGLFSSKPKGYIPRENWDAVESHISYPLHHPVPIVHITAVEGQTYIRDAYHMYDCMRLLRELQKMQMFDDGYPDIAYNFYVGGDGNVYEGRGWYDAPTLTEEEHPDDTEAVAIAYIRPKPGCRPTKLMMSKVKEVIDDGIKKGFIDNKYVIEGLIDGLDEA